MRARVAQVGLAILVTALVVWGARTWLQGAGSDEFVVNTYTAGYQINPSVAVSRNGDFVVTWSGKDQDGDLYGIFGQRFAGSGDRIGAEFQVNTVVFNNQRDSDVAVADDGSFVVVWEGWYQEGQDFEVYGRLFDAQGRPRGDEFRINEHTASYQKDPTVAMSADGGFVVAWMSFGQGGDGNMVHARRFDARGRALGDEFAVSPRPVDAREVPIMVTAPDLEFRSEEEQVAVATDAAGNFVIVYSGLNDNHADEFDDCDVFGRRYDAAGVALGGEFQVNTGSAGNQLETAVAMAGDGRFVVAWMGPSESDGMGVLARRFDAGGQPLGAEFQVNVYEGRDRRHTVEEQGFPTVSMDDDGSFVIA